VKIAFIPATFLPTIGGSEIQAHNLANKICEKHHIDIYLLNYTNLKNIRYKIKFLPKIIINLVYLFKYYFNLDFTIIYKIYFINLIKKKSYDIWHFHSLNYKTLLFAKVLKSLNQKIIITFQGADIQIDKKINYGYRLKKKYNDLFQIVVRKADRFIAISDNIKKDLELLNIDNSKIEKIPNSVSRDRINNTGLKKFNEFTILTVGRYAEKKKGFDLVKKISKHLLKKIHFKWIIIGRNTSELLKKNFFKINKKNFLILDQIENNKDLLFPNDTLIKYYKKSHVYANLARLESFGVTIIEAMASFLPIVSFRTKGADELIIHKKNGFFISDNNYSNFAKILIRIKKNKNIYKSVFKFNSKYIKEYDLKITSKKTINLYKNVINN